MASHSDISKAVKIGGWMNESELEWLANQASRFQYIVEFGSLHGRSTRALCDNLMPYGKVWAVDPWGGEYIYDNGNKVPFSTYVYPYFIRNLADHIKAGRCIPSRGLSYQFRLMHKVDMVFIDGDHRYDTVVKDIKKAYELLRPNGLICGHDYNHDGWPGVKTAVDQYVHNVQTQGFIWYSLKS